MASHGELYNFVRKFGCNAKLYVETEAGHVVSHLQVVLGQAQQGREEKKRGWQQDKQMKKLTR